MYRNKTLALMISAAALTPVSAQAVDIFGFINVGIENTSISGAGAVNEIFATGVDGSTHGQDIAETRFGFKDSRELPNGMTGSFKIEMGIGTSDAAEGGTYEDSTPTTRIAQVALSGDFGTVTVGNQWGILYEYLGWNIYRTHGHGGGTWYHTTQHINDDAYGLRVQNAFTYTYGGGGYSTDPFTFSVQVVAEPDTPTNDEFMDAVVLAGAYTTGNLTINAVSYSESDGSGAAEPSLIGLGARYNISSDTYVGGTYMTVDNDQGADLSSLNILLTQNFGNGLSGMIGYGFSDADAPLLELNSNLLLQLEKDYGEGLVTYIEIETAELSNGDETQIIAGNLKFSF